MLISFARYRAISYALRFSDVDVFTLF